MHTFWAKTTIQNVGTGTPPAAVTINGHNIDTTEKLTHIESDVDSSGYSSPNICRRIGLAASTMGQLDRVWSSRRLRLSSKLRVYNTCVLPVLLYGSDTWTLPKEDERKLQAFHMR